MVFVQQNAASVVSNMIPQGTFQSFPQAIFDASAWNQNTFGVQPQNLRQKVDDKQKQLLNMSGMPLNNRSNVFFQGPLQQVWQGGTPQQIPFVPSVPHWTSQGNMSQTWMAQPVPSYVHANSSVSQSDNTNPPQADSPSRQSNGYSALASPTSPPAQSLQSNFGNQQGQPIALPANATIVSSRQGRRPIIPVPPGYSSKSSTTSHTQDKPPVPPYAGLPTSGNVQPPPPPAPPPPLPPPPQRVNSSVTNLSTEHSIKPQSKQESPALPSPQAGLIPSGSNDQRKSQPFQNENEAEPTNDVIKKSVPKVKKPSLPISRPPQPAASRPVVKEVVPSKPVVLEDAAQEYFNSLAPLAPPPAETKKRKRKSSKEKKKVKSKGVAKKRKSKGGVSGKVKSKRGGARKAKSKGGVSR